MKYVLGRGNWFESIVVGVFVGIFFLIAIPFMVLAAVLVFIAGITGFLKRDE